MKFSLHQFLKVVTGIVADNHAVGTVNGPAIDRRGFEEALVVVNSGVNGTGGTVNVKVQESDASDSGFADITDAAFSEITEDNDNTVYVGRLNLVGRKRYLRVVATVGTAACDLGVDVILGAASELPVTQVNNVAFSL